MHVPMLDPVTVTVTLALPDGRTVERTFTVDPDDLDGPILDRRVALVVRDLVSEAGHG